MPRSANTHPQRVAGLLAAALILAAASVVHAASLQQVSNWTGGVPNLPSDVQMYIYVPDKVVADPPVLTLIHSCDSNASVVLGQASGLKSAADQYGFIIVVPQSNPTSLRCWTTDSTQVWTRNDGGDSNAIKQMVVYALSKYQANADRVYVTGCSSGAMMTELLLALYPDIFKAGSSFAGMPAGCHGPNDNTSNATGYNGTCAGGPVSSYTAQQWGDLVRAMDPGYTGHRPRLQLFHGSADPTISYSNMAESEEQYINLLGLSTNPTKTNTGLTLGTHQATEQQWNDSCGYLVLDGFESIGGDHGPSDALFVPQYVVPFLGLDKTGPTDPEIAQCGSGGAGGSAGTSGGAGSGGTGSGGQAGSTHSGTGGAAGGPGGGGRGGAAGSAGTAGAGTSGAGGIGTGGAGTGGRGSTGTAGTGGTGTGGTGTGGTGTGGRGTGGTLATGGSSGTGGGASGGASAETGSGGATTGGTGGSQAPGNGSGGSGCSCDVAATGLDSVLGFAIFLGLVQLLLRLRHARNAARGANRRPLY
jgi:acetylxylan esterase